MTCATLRERLDAYAGGLLSPEDAEAFEHHLDGCDACAALLASVAAPPACAGLPRAIEPAADLWPGIQARLRPRSGAHPPVTLPRWALAAAALLLIALSSGATLLLLRRFSAPAPAAGEAAAALTPLEADYVRAAADLEAALQQARGRLAPSTVAIVERNLAVIDSALAESRRALAADPGNAMLQQLVIAAWEQKVDFLRRASALAPAG